MEGQLHERLTIDQTQFQEDRGKSPLESHLHHPLNPTFIRRVDVDRVILASDDDATFQDEMEEVGVPI